MSHRPTMAFTEGSACSATLLLGVCAAVLALHLLHLPIEAEVRVTDAPPSRSQRRFVCRAGSCTVIVGSQVRRNGSGLFARRAQCLDACAASHQSVQRPAPLRSRHTFPVNAARSSNQLDQSHAEQEHRQQASSALTSRQGTRLHLSDTLNKKTSMQHAGHEATMKPLDAWQQLSRVQLTAAPDEQAIFDWLLKRHIGACDYSTAVYFAPFSPNGIGNKLLGIVMSFHMSIMTGRKLVVTDWPPRTLSTRYPLDQILRPSSCQRRFDEDPQRKSVTKCTVGACPTQTASSFTNSYTQPHWAHQSESFLAVPLEWKHISWPSWWRALTQFLLRPGDKLLKGLASQLSGTTLATSQPSSTSALRIASGSNSAATLDGFARRFSTGVAAWDSVPRPLIGAHVRIGDGCWDSKRGGCKYVQAFSDIVGAIRASGFTQGTIFLATDNATIAAQALASPPDGFVLATLREDRTKVQKSHGHQEGEEMLHLQLLDLALLSQTDVLVGVFGSTFIKTALQLGHATEYVSLDTFHWCPLLRCYWGWRDLCHNCDMCLNLGGAGEACVQGAYHTPFGLQIAMRGGGEARQPFRSFMKLVLADSQCRAWSAHPQGRSQGRPKAQWPVVGSVYAPPLPEAQAEAACTLPHAKQYTPGDPCACGFQRYRGVDNAAAQRSSQVGGFGLSNASLATPSLHECELACCNEPLCHSAVWESKAQHCTLSLALAHGPRMTDWCWHPTMAPTAVSSLRLPGAWELAAVELARNVLSARSLVDSGGGSGPHTFMKGWNSAQHYGLKDHAIRATSCAATSSRGSVHVSAAAIAAFPKHPSRMTCH